MSEQTTQHPGESLRMQDQRAVEQFHSACAAAALDPRVRVTLRGRVLWLLIDRPEQHNALALTMLDSLATVLQIAAAQLAPAADPDWLRLVVLTGAGEHSFAAGGDLKELDSVRSRAQTERMTRRGMAALNAFRDFPLPVLAGLNGTARGGGAELALACDMRVAHPAAGIGFIQGRLNLAPAWGGGTDLVARLGPSAALRVLAEAQVLGAAQAQAQGLVDVLLDVAPTAFADALRDYVEQLAERPAQVLAAHKALLLAAAGGTQRAHSQALESAQLVQTWTHADHWRAAAGALPGKSS